MNVRFVKTVIIKMNYSFTNVVITIFARIVFMNIIYNIYHIRTPWITVLVARVVIVIFVLQKFQDMCFVVIFPILKFQHCRVMMTIMMGIKMVDITITNIMKTIIKKANIMKTTIKKTNIKKGFEFIKKVWTHRKKNLFFLKHI